MFDIGFAEIVIVFVIGLLVLGPERLPKAARYIGTLFAKARNAWNGIQMEIERELQLDELKKQAQSMKQNVEHDIQTELDSAQQMIEQTEQSLQELAQSTKASTNTSPKPTIDSHQTPNSHE